MAEVFFIGDTHFGHEKILQFSAQRGNFSCIEEHDEMIVSRWNAAVTKRDTVWHMGDVAFRDSLPIVKRLNGYKRLVMGNHEHKHSNEYAKYFDRLYGVTEYKGFVLSHIPVHDSQKTRYKGNIHGHLHGKSLADKWYMNVSCEQINCTPISFENLTSKQWN